MKDYSVNKLAEIIGASIRGEADGRVFNGVNIDSRRVKKGECFFAIKGLNYDGHNFVEDALAKGAVCAVVEKGFSGGSCGAVLEVDDAVAALGQLAHRRRCESGFKVVAITGSVGKTTTREIVYHVLSGRFRCYQSPENFNNIIGLSLTLLGASEDDEVVIAEIGSSYSGEVSNLSQTAEPDIALVTNIYPAHLAGFGSVEAVAREKFSIADGLRNNGVLIFNGDFGDMPIDCKAAEKEFVSFGFGRGNDIKGADIVCRDLWSGFTIGGVEIDVPLAGRGNVENVLAVWAVCSRLGVDIDYFRESVKKMDSVAMRAEVLKAGKGFIINDCYNANPASMENGLDILAAIGKGRGGRKVFICGDMAELGQMSEQYHYALGEYIAKTRVDVLISVGRGASTAAKAAQKQPGYEAEVFLFDERDSLFEKLGEIIKKTDIVLVKGSRLCGLEKVVERLKDIFVGELAKTANEDMR